MKNTIAVVIGVVLVFAMFFSAISYSNYINRYKAHVYTAEEVYAIECAKRGGSVTTEKGTDASGSKNLKVQEFKCEGADDVRN